METRKEPDISASFYDTGSNTGRTYTVVSMGFFTLSVCMMYAILVNMAYKITYTIYITYISMLDRSSIHLKSESTVSSSWNVIL